MAVQLVVAICETGGGEELFEDIYLLQCKLLPIATRLGEDKSPNVRLAVAQQCDRLVAALGGHWVIVLADLFHALLSDPDPRVRCEAVYTIPRFAQQVFNASDLQEEVLGGMFGSMQKVRSIVAMLPQIPGPSFPTTE